MNASAEKPPRLVNILGTPLLATSYGGLQQELLSARAAGNPRTIDFTNTHIVTARRHDPQFREVTRVFDTFVPDGMPLIWCMNARGAGLSDRVYGPTFMRFFLSKSPPEVSHFFFGASSECLTSLVERMRALNPQLNIAGTHNGYFDVSEEARIVGEIARLQPDFLWVGLGTPKQQNWIHAHRAALGRSIVMAVGFAFDVNAGTKKDAPIWMQRAGLTWIFRLLSEPRRLWSRYVRYNSLFLFYLLADLLPRQSRVKS